MFNYSLYQECIKENLSLEKNQWNFKANDRYTFILEHVSLKLGNSYLFEITTRFASFYNKNKNFLIELCKTNDLYGNTKKEIFYDFTTCSPSNLRYILHSLLILEYMSQCCLNDIDAIEIGGGYGGLCFFINKLSPLFKINIESYTFFDLPEPLLLQQKYLNDFGFKNLKFEQLCGFESLKKNSFLISNYAYSEIREELRDEYTNKILNPYVSHGFMTWNIINFYNFIEDKIITKEQEYPLTGSNNLYVRFRPLIT
jgi:hypothetical protein